MSERGQEHDASSNRGTERSYFKVSLMYEDESQVMTEDFAVKAETEQSAIDIAANAPRAPDEYSLPIVTEVPEEEMPL